MNLKDLLYQYFQAKPSISFEGNAEFQDFTSIEKELGFRLHDDLKTYFGSFFFDEMEGVLASSRIPATEKWGHWFEFNGGNPRQYWPNLVSV